MSEQIFAELDERKGDGQQVFDRLVEQLRAEKNYHKLFDARMLRKKQALGLSLARPTSLQDVPDDERKEVEQEYVEAAREVGSLLLEEGKIPEAWMYFQVIRETDPVRDALEQLPISREPDERLEELLSVALYQGANPPKGVQLMLAAHGTCSTITALDQQFPQLPADERQQCAKIMVRSLYEDLCGTVRREVEAKLAMIPPGENLKELIAGRDWLFEGGNYHIDTSHLNAVVRFARAIEAPAEELELARQLCSYGTQLDQQLQYPGEPPFEDFYAAHEQFFNVLLDHNRDEGLNYFRQKLAAEPDERDKPMLAYVLVDLLVRVDQKEEAVDIAAEHLTHLGDEVNFSFVELCEQAGRLDVLKTVARKNDDPVLYAAAIARDATP